MTVACEFFETDGFIAFSGLRIVIEDSEIYPRGRQVIPDVINGQV